MEQEKTVEQEKLNAFVPHNHYTVSQPITLGGPPYLTPRTTRSVTSRETRRTIFEYLKQLWIHQTDALTIAKEKTRTRSVPYTSGNKNSSNLHEGKRQTQNRWNNKSPFKRQRPN